MAAVVRAGRFSIWLLVVNFNISFSIGLQFRADVFQIPQQRQALPVSCNHMTTRQLILSLTIFTCISCSHPSDKTNSTDIKDPTADQNLNSYQVDTTKLSIFDWTQLKDTTKYNIRYLQLNFFNVPDDSTVGQNILKFTDSINNKSFLLTGRQEYQLYQLINDATNFSEGDCGTFYLNAGILVFDKDKICGTINIGCGYNQWNFSSENLNAKYGAFNERGFSKMQQLLDDINLSSKK
jgi:hypothetical protein